MTKEINIFPALVLHKLCAKKNISKKLEFKTDQ